MLFDIDFDHKKYVNRIPKHKYASELVIKAIGKKIDEDLFVLDATSGFGVESFVMSAYGCKVHMCEQNIELNSSLVRAINNNIVHRNITSRMSIVGYCALKYISTTKVKYDVIYLDPMFPNKKRKANKNMNYLQGKNIVCSSDDLFVQAVKSGARRIVVKRHKKSPFISDIAPVYSKFGKSHRYDIYFQNNIKI